MSPKENTKILVADMCKLASLAYNCTTQVIHGTLVVNCHILLHTLQRTGSSVLVAYDSDRNFSPCVNHGHTAHWAIVTGKQPLIAFWAEI